MALRAKQPEVKDVQRAKILVSGEAGSGKTFFSLNFPNVYFIDSEMGAVRGQYQERLKTSGGMYFGRDEGATDFNEVIKEVRSLASDKHAYKTVVVDSLSHLYNMESAEAELRVGNAFGADRKEANKPCRQLLRWIDKIDMNVILICHSKADWANRDKDGQPGTSYDAYDKVAYSLDLWLEIIGKEFVVRKTRIDSFQEGMRFNREYKAFSELFGNQLINKAVESLVLANDKEIELATKLAQGLNLSGEELNKFFHKANVDSFSEMTSNQIISLINFFQKRIDLLK